MSSKALFVIYMCFHLIDARESANAKDLPSIFNDTGARYSDNVFVDATLDVPALVRKYGYPLEVHYVVTKDDYILEMHRIPHGRDNHNVPDYNKTVVMLMHGLFSSSADWVLMGPGSGFAYILAEEGYDVWMGNARGNYYSRHNMNLNADNINFWKFSWDEIGNYDLPAMIDYTLAFTRNSKLHYIGHSQGTTSFFVMGSLRPDYNEKIITMQALAPVAYMAHNQNPLLRFIAPFSNKIEKITSFFGIGEFMPNSEIRTIAGEALCRDDVKTQVICSNIIFLVGGWNEAQLNETMIPVIFGHTPAGSSVRQLAHYGQSIAKKGFRRYDHGWITNLKVYGSIKPPSYELSKVTAPVFLHYAEKDLFAEVEDVDTLWEQLGRPIQRIRVPDPDFTHLDFMWAIDVKKLVYDRVISLIKKPIDNEV